MSLTLTAAVRVSARLRTSVALGVGLFTLAGGTAEADPLAGSLAALRAAGFPRAARVIEGRHRQRSPKLRLDPAQAAAAALQVLEVGRERPAVGALEERWPATLVELCRAVRQRDLAPGEAEAMGRYLVGLWRGLRPGRPGALDEQLAHVIGRRWAEIDYRGEGLSNAAQERHWGPRGVPDFRRALHLHRYFVAAERLPYFRRTVDPAGSMAAVAAPAEPAPSPEPTP